MGGWWCGAEGGLGLRQGAPPAPGVRTAAAWPEGPGAGPNRRTPTAQVWASLSARGTGHRGTCTAPFVSVEGLPGHLSSPPPPPVFPPASRGPPVGFERATMRGSFRGPATRVSAQRRVLVAYPPAHPPGLDTVQRRSRISAVMHVMPELEVLGSNPGGVGTQ